MTPKFGTGLGTSYPVDTRRGNATYRREVWQLRRPPRGPHTPADNQLTARSWSSSLDTGPASSSSSRLHHHHADLCWQKSDPWLAAPRAFGAAAASKSSAQRAEGAGGCVLPWPDDSLCFAEAGGPEIDEDDSVFPAKTSSKLRCDADPWLVQDRNAGDIPDFLGPSDPDPRTLCRSRLLRCRRCRCSQRGDGQEPEKQAEVPPSSGKKMKSVHTQTTLRKEDKLKFLEIK